MSRHDGCCAILHLREDNARFVLLAMVMSVYMVSGAGIFMVLERAQEVRDKASYNATYHSFLQHNLHVNETELHVLLRKHAEFSSAGLVGERRQRWDFSGSFYFVATVVSTIGFGMTTPRTSPGRIFLIFYGILGCAGAILFFNLFLERIITFLAFLLRWIHERRMRQKGLLGNRRGSRGSEDEDSLDSWKPSVWWVMLILFLGATVIACCASAMYQPVEKWSYIDCIYFCFVAFATIGFGDLVVSQQAWYPMVHLYRFGNFLFLMIGCCCIYSLFNVTSIVIKQFLNWLIVKLDFDCRCLTRPKPRPRRNAITPNFHKSSSGHQKAPDLTDVDSNYDSEGSRRGSGEMISMCDFLKSNKISLAMMQKQLQETDNRGAFRTSESGGSGPVGPLAILNQKLGQEDV